MGGVDAVCSAAARAAWKSPAGALPLAGAGEGGVNCEVLVVVGYPNCHRTSLCLVSVASSYISTGLPVSVELQERDTFLVILI